MKVKVKYFASLKDSIGRAEETLELSSSITVQQLWLQVSGENDISDTIKSAVNMEYVNKDTLVNDGDEIAFFPPVTGG